MPNDRNAGKKILRLALRVPIDRLRDAWEQVAKDPELRRDLFGEPHAKEIDLMVRNLGKYDTVHLKGDPFGEHLRSLHSGAGMKDEDAAAVLDDPSGVRLSHRAVMLAPGTDAHRMTMGILNARYKENQNAGAKRRAVTPISGKPPVDSEDQDSWDGKPHDEGHGGEDLQGGSAPLAGDQAGNGPDGEIRGEPAGGSAPDSGGGDDGTRRVTGSADIPLTEGGEDQIEEMVKTKMVKPFDQVFCAPSDRSRETAEKFSDDPIEVPALDGWARGELEGQPMDSVKKQVRDLILNPDTVPTGKSPESGKPGQSFNAFLKPLLREIISIERGMKPDQRVLVITSGGNLQVIDSWAKAGSPVNLKFGYASMAANPYWSVTGKLFRMEGGLKEVEDDEEPVLYLMEHGKTSFNSGPTEK